MEETNPSGTENQEQATTSPGEQPDRAPAPEAVAPPPVDRPVWSAGGAGPWRWILVALLVLLFCGFTLTKVVSFDVWWHLEAGTYFLGGGPLSGEDPFSFTAQGEGHKWIEGHWLYQILLALLHKAGGFNLLIIFKAALICAAFFLLYRKLADGRRSPMMAPFVFGLAVLAVAERFIIRPESASYLFIAVFILLLEGYRRNPRISLLVWLVLLQLVWVNVQGLFALGLVLVGCYLAGELVRWRINLPYHWDASNPLKDKPWIMLAGAGLLCLVVCLINPSGLDGALFPFEQFQMIQGEDNIFRQNIAEFDRPFADRFAMDSPGTVALICLLGVTILSFLLTWKQWDLTRVLLFGLFLFLALSARRNIAIYALVAAPLTVINYRQWAAGLPDASAFRRMGERLQAWRPALAVAVAAFLCCGIWLAASDHYFIETVGSTKFGLGVNEDVYPSAAADLILEHDLQGPLYNELGFGGYLIHRLYPERKVFIDGRNEVYGEALFRRYMDSSNFPDQWYDLAREYDLQLALLNQRAPINYRLAMTLAGDPEWAIIQHDGTSVLFARKGGVNDAAVAALETDLSMIRELPPGLLPDEDSRRSLFGRLYPAAEIHLGQFYYNLGLLHLATPAYQRAVELDDGLVSTRFYLGVCYAHSGEMDKAVEQFHEVIAREPDMLLAYEQLAMVFHNTNRVEQALAYYKRAVDRMPQASAGGIMPPEQTEHLFNLRLRMGDCYLRMNLPDEAQLEFDRAIELKPGHATHEQVAKVFHNTNQVEQALTHYRQALELLPAAEGDGAVAPDQAEYRSTLRVGMGDCFLRMDAPGEAQAEFDRAIALTPTHLTHELVAKSFHNTNRLDRALAYYAQAIDLVPEVAEGGITAAERLEFVSDLHTSVGDCYLRMNRPEEAMVEFERAVELNPTHLNMRFNVAYAHQVLIDVAANAGDEARMQRELGLAITAYEKVLEMDPQHFRTLFNLAFLNTNSGRLQEGRRYFLAFLAVPGIDENFRAQAREYLAQIEQVLAQEPAAGPVATGPATGAD